MFVCAFKRTYGGQTVDVGAKDKEHYTLRQRVEKIFPVRLRFFQVKEFDKRALSKKGMDFVTV